MQWTNSLEELRVNNVQLEVIANERWIYPGGRNLAMFSANIRPWQVPGYNPIVQLMFARYLTG